MAPGSPDVLFLSLRPRYAEMILVGAKTAEVRRVRPRAQPRTQVLLYAASPMRQVVGRALITDIVHASISQLWRRYGARTALSRPELNDYLKGAATPTVLLLDDVRPLDHPVALEDLRRVWPRFQPPQSYRYLAADAVTELLDVRAMALA